LIALTFALALAGEGVRFVRQQLFHFGHVGREEGHVVADEGLQPLARLGVAVRPRAARSATGEHPEEAALLDTETAALPCPRT